ncbi:hypothetical protein Zmor_004118 [Zophobas morio]|uniref:Uncharacterized protein n=1 Tax=Zophobas morio TaxID=2755281 RepID=A0AA38HJH2_9CUCU|nr:hypothetical protein Zmor_004118 [Zophobas morio]
MLKIKSKALIRNTIFERSQWIFSTIHVLRDGESAAAFREKDADGIWCYHGDGLCEPTSGVAMTKNKGCLSRSKPCTCSKGKGALNMAMTSLIAFCVCTFRG